MSTVLSIPLRRFLKTIVPLVAIASGTLFVQASPEALWSEGVPGGQWRAFGNGVLDSRVLADPPGLSVQVDWEQATFGTGLAYEQREGGAPFPTVPERGRVTFEARVVSADGGEALSQVRAEWVARAGGGEEQVVPLVLKELAGEPGEWVRCEFEFGDATPRLAALRSRLNALRLVFPKAGRSGQGRVEVRGVELHGD